VSRLVRAVRRGRAEAALRRRTVRARARGALLRRRSEAALGRSSERARSGRALRRRRPEARLPKRSRRARSTARRRCAEAATGRRCTEATLRSAEASGLSRRRCTEAARRGRWSPEALRRRRRRTEARLLRRLLRRRAVAGRAAGCTLRRRSSERTRGWTRCLSRPSHWRRTARRRSRGRRAAGMLSRRHRSEHRRLEPEIAPLRFLLLRSRAGRAVLRRLRRSVLRLSGLLGRRAVRRRRRSGRRATGRRTAGSWRLTGRRLSSAGRGGRGHHHRALELGSRGCARRFELVAARHALRRGVGVRLSAVRTEDGHRVSSRERIIALAAAGEGVGSRAKTTTSGLVPYTVRGPLEKRFFRAIPSSLERRDRSPAVVRIATIAAPADERAKRSRAPARTSSRDGFRGAVLIRPCLTWTNVTPSVPPRRAGPARARADASLLSFSGEGAGLLEARL
jgi:hypothetical protein